MSGHLASDDIDDVAAEARVEPKLPFHADGFELQARYVFRRIARVLEAASSSLEHVVNTRVWPVIPSPGQVSADVWHDISLGRFAGARREHFRTVLPAGTVVGVGELLVRNTLLEIDATAVIPAPGEVIEPVRAPIAAGMPELYSPGVRLGGWAFLSGGLPVDWPHGGAITGANWYESPIRVQTDRALTNLAVFAEAASTTLHHAVKAIVFLADPRDYVGFEEVWRSWFPASPPARTIVTGVSPALPGARVEVALSCIVPGRGLEKTVIETGEAPEPIGHQPQAIKAGSFLFLSGQMAAGPDGIAAGVIPDSRFPYYGAPARQQMRYILGNVGGICEAAGTSLQNVCRRRAFHLGLSDSVYSIEEWAAHFPGDKPASTTIRVGGPLLVPGCDVLLDLVAWVPDSSH